MRRGCVISLVGASAALAAAGCSSNPDRLTGECTARVRYHDQVFVPDNHLNQQAPRGAALGPAEVIDCGDPDTAKAVQTVAVYRVVGVGSDVAVVIGEGGRYDGVYVNAEVPVRRWPDPLRKR